MAKGKGVDELRKEIDGIDDEIVALLNKRATRAIAIGQAKAQTDAAMYVPEREHKLLKRLEEVNEGPLSAQSLRLIYKEIISASLALEAPLAVAFLGPEATFTHEASKRQFGLSARLVPMSSITEVFEGVERRRFEYGVVPVENSTEGMVNHTLDMLMTCDLLVSAEILLRVGHHVMTQSGSLETVSKVYSHKQALAQCRAWIERNLPQAAMVDVASTARAAQLASQDPTGAAIASELAASMYDLRVAASFVQDVAENITRFLVIGKREMAPTGHDLTSIMFAVKDRPGILATALKTFANNKINLTRIESRPSRKRAWDYHFFVDLEGHQTDENVAAAIAELKKSSDFLKVLGSYPRGVLEDT